ncbi:MAG: hypothetical protein EBZ53_04460 [Verrucomicrobia bacterium]|nr:hypothetical protein [Verrucomicrobiota bacterium]
MKKALLLSLCLMVRAYSHDHVEVGLSPTDTNHLALDGPKVQYAVYVPHGEAFSGYATNFPGACFASELTFTTETDVLNPAIDANPDIELISVAGPIEGSFSFWEAGSVEPTWARPTGWSHRETDTPSFPVILNGNDHIHGRIFSTDRPGDYQVTFRATDKNSRLQRSAEHTITFRAVKPPPLTILVDTHQVVLSFSGRTNFTYDFQLSTNLASGNWTNLATQSGPSTNSPFLTNQLVIPLSHPRAFFRLVEFQ